ncbi:hypothetical protein A1QO_15580 [Vibrio genomosp. F10 str. ZF-129]|uniref:Uncharacterized protein n=1 Tax=Vibrio genomosp. F10 str. ZF-129 TaxID=1187848 RepID=A0A1E5BA18_9VIBR|nr:hypothetical protein [Vibrio genomosp. F10]OEE30752.1 hypothetical protein A1QO_15580 [Vibrio genomosp. F10 str. ZF-129]
MKKQSISKEVLQMLDGVVESKATKEKLEQEASAARHEYKKQLEGAANLLHDQASKSDALADQFFTEEGVLYKGQLFLFDDEGALVVGMGPQVIEVEV